MGWPPPKEAPPFLVAEETPPQEYGPWQWAASLGRATGLICAEAFTRPREREAALPSGGKPALRVKCVKRMHSRERAVSPLLPDRLSALFPAGAVLGERRPKE